MKKLLLLALLFSATQVSATTLSSNIKAGEIALVKISQLHPTQASVGYREMDYKEKRYHDDQKKMFADYCESAGQKGVAKFDQHSTLTNLTSFSCKLPVGSQPNEMKTAVIAPNNELYLTDGHHTFTNFAALSGQNTPVYVRITDDFRSLKTMPQFWETMQEKHLVWLDTPTGDIKPSELPKTLTRSEMQNDEYRSLMYYLRDIGFKKPNNPPPFLEFYWGKWLQKQLPLTDFDLNTKQGYAKVITAAAEKMTSIPLNTIIAETETGPVTAEQMGSLKKVNKKELNKLLSATGKLSWAFL